MWFSQLQRSRLGFEFEVRNGFRVSCDGSDGEWIAPMKILSKIEAEGCV